MYALLTLRKLAISAIFFIFTNLLIAPLKAQKAEIAIPDTLALFEDESPFVISLLFDFKSLLKHKYKDEYQSALLTYYSDGQQLEKEIRVKARGELRKKICYLPPLKLNFKKTHFDSDAMYPLTSLKLVTNCKNANIFEQYVFKEYLAYQLFQLLTPISFRTRLTEITYIDSQAKVKSFTKHGIILEQTKHVAKRIGCVELEEVKMSQRSAQRRHMVLVAMFQFMIGNTDWAVPDLHNVKVLKKNDYTQEILYVVPYDFDYSGFVNAAYAIPHPDMNIETVRDRLYLGTCVSEEEWESTIDLFLAKKEAMYDLINKFPLFSASSRKECQYYLYEFFNCIENTHLWKGTFTSTCK